VTVPVADLARPCALNCRTPEPRPAVPAWQLCSACVNRLAWMLHDIPDLYALLDEVIDPAPHALSSGRRAPGFWSRPPARDDVIALRDNRTTALEDGDPHSALELLRSWADNVRDDLHLDPPTGSATVTGEARLLSANLGYIAAAHWVDDFAAEITELHRALRRVTGNAARIVDLGACPGEITDEHTGATRACGATLRANLDDEACQCRRCGANWPRQAWLRLADGDPDRLAALGVTGR
jgi:hypothetical protein